MSAALLWYRHTLRARRPPSSEFPHHAYSVRHDVATLEVDGSKLRIPFEITPDVAALGGVGDDKVIYFRETRSESKKQTALYFAVEIGKSFLRPEVEKLH
jgi:hypothetical protein